MADFGNQIFFPAVMLVKSIYLLKVVLNPLTLFVSVNCLSVRKAFQRHGHLNLTIIEKKTIAFAGVLLRRQGEPLVILEGVRT